MVRATDDLFDRAGKVISDALALRLARRRVLQEAQIWIGPEREVALRQLQARLYAPAEQKQTGS